MKKHRGLGSLGETVRPTTRDSLAALKHRLFVEAQRAKRDRRRAERAAQQVEVTR